MRTALALLVLLTLVVATVSGALTLAGPAGRQPSWRPVGEIVLLTGAWLLSNGPLEGAVLWAPFRTHGLTLADLLAVPTLVVAGLLVAQRL
ncbi:MAG: hypothetical protein QOE84_3361 [Actinomycetota bacterium]|jgi:hypothetical protein|nr:hypothetical protein [Actinomycetota bacterium]